MNWRIAFVAILWGLVILSAFAVVISKQQTRAQFQSLTALEKERDSLEVEWSRLQLEQASLANLSRIEQQASSKLDMLMPRVGDAVMVEP